MSAAELNRIAAGYERLADRRARKARALAGRAAFLDRQGESRHASALLADVQQHERRELQLLDLAQALRRHASRLEAHGRRTDDLFTLVQGARSHVVQT